MALLSSPECSRALSPARPVRPDVVGGGVEEGGGSGHRSVKGDALGQRKARQELGRSGVEVLCGQERSGVEGWCGWPWRAARVGSPRALIRRGRHRRVTLRRRSSAGAPREFTSSVSTGVLQGGRTGVTGALLKLSYHMSRLGLAEGGAPGGCVTRLRTYIRFPHKGGHRPQRHVRLSKLVT